MFIVSQHGCSLQRHINICYCTGKKLEQSEE